MTPTEKSYLAGIIDGEGSIMLIKFHNNQFPAPCVSVASTSLELLEWIKEKTNLGTIKKKKIYDIKKHKPSFTYITKYDEAIEILKLISPYLVIESKKLRAALTLNEYKSLTPRNGRYSQEMLVRKENFYNKFIMIK